MGQLKTTAWARLDGSVSDDGYSLKLIQVPQIRPHLLYSLRLGACTLERGVLGEAQSGVSTIGFELSSYMLARGRTNGVMLEPDGDNAEVERLPGYIIYAKTHIQVR